MHHTQVPIIGFAAHSGTGKTTLLTQVIPQLNLQGLRVGLIKHSHHHFDIDIPGKDSYRLTAAGAATVLLTSPYRRAIMSTHQAPQEPRLEDELAELNYSQLDLILVEGFRSANFPKIELHRSALNRPFIYPNDPDIIAVASDTALMLPAHLHSLDINKPSYITRFILDFIYPILNRIDQPIP